MIGYDAHAQAKGEVAIEVWCKLMGLGRAFEIGVCRDVEVVYDGTRVIDVIDQKGTCETRRVGCDEFVPFTRYVGSCGRGGWLWRTSLFGDGPSPHR